MKDRTDMKDSQLQELDASVFYKTLKEEGPEEAGKEVNIIEILDERTQELSSERKHAISENLHTQGGFEFHAEFEGTEKTDKGDRFIQGYANTKNLDLMRDIVEPGAFRKSFKYWLKNGVILLHHDWTIIVGKPVEAKIDDKGFFIKVQIFKGLTPESKIEETWNLIEQGGLKAFSIGFRIIKSKYEQDENEREFRRILELVLLETSIVSIPANRESLFSVSKGIEFGTDLIDIETGEAALSIDELNNEKRYEELIRRVNEINEELKMREEEEIEERMKRMIGRIENI